jgi:hypothetical protein
MSKLIIYKSETDQVQLMIPIETCGLSIEEIARKDVPPGCPYHIVDRSQIPTDMTFYAAWEADFNNPTGHGIGSVAFWEEKEQA